MKGQKGRWQALAAVTLVIWAGTALGQAPKPVAMVNGQAISEAELNEILKRQSPSPTPLTEAQRLQQKQGALDILINDVIMRQFLQREFAGKPIPKPNGPEVNKQLAEMEAGLKKNKMSLAQFLKDTGQTEAQLRANIVKGIMWESYLSSLVTDDKVRRYYDEYKPFFDNVKVRASHILIRLPANAKDIDRQVARNKLLVLRQDILANKITFADAAKKYSECADTRARGGDFGGAFRRRFELAEPLARAAFGLKVGDISDVVESDIGVHLVKTTERSAGEPSDFEKIKADVGRIYMMELGSQVTENLYREAKVEVNLK